MTQEKTVQSGAPELAEQLAAELIATRQQLAAVQQQLAFEQAAAQQRAVDEQQLAQQRYGQIAQSVEQFIEGKATVGDVVKNVSASIAQDENLLKGAVVGAAAAVLLTSGPVRSAMGKTVEGIFPGLGSKDSAAAAGGTTGAATGTAKAGGTVVE